MKKNYLFLHQSMGLGGNPKGLEHIGGPRFIHRSDHSLGLLLLFLLTKLFPYSFALLNFSSS